MTQFNWDDMQFFLALARDGQLTGAARQLGSSHVTVARRIDRLEGALRQRLFERSARGYELTASGRRLVETAERMEEASGGITPGEGPGQGLTGSLRLAVPEGFSNFFSEHMLAAFIARFPGLSLELITLTQVISLSRREADLTVTLDPVTRGGYRSELMAEYHLRIYAAQSYLAQHGPIRARADLPQHPFLGYIEEMLFATGLDYLGEVHPGLRPGFKSSSIFSQMTAARQAVGLCVLPCYMAEGCADLVPVLPAEITLKRGYWLTCHRDTRQMRRERAVIAFLMEEIRRHDRLLMGQNAAR
ncbi:LysR family transcriptional regulator [Neotabrizicola sp. VNH66]|uniref:LysR family transcriptional regulator n=1 Tax=Neotabrizicola sp. VNH66 TaxID=3400918 RepID=UPI003BFDA57E